MSGLSDRDQKIIYVLLIAMIICLPYFFFITDKKAETDAIKVEVASLQEKYQTLLAMNDSRDTWVKETTEYNKKRDDIIKGFPGEIEQANYTMFLLNTEYSGKYEVDPENGALKRVEPIWFSKVNYGTSKEIPISSVDADTGLTGVKNSSIVEYTTNYKGLKYLLGYLESYSDPMIYSHITMKFDEKTGLIGGEFILDQYAVTGPDRPTLGAPSYSIGINGKDLDLDLDKNKLRGNEDVELNGVFGPKDITAKEFEEQEKGQNNNAVAEEVEEETEE